MTTPSSNNPPVVPPTTEEEKELAFGQVWDGAAKKTHRPSIAHQSDGGRRKSSVQFHTADAEETIRRESVTLPPRQSVSQRMSSPPPPPTYHRGVSFDTFDNKDASTESFTLQYRHANYHHSTRSRTFLCGTDTKDHSEYAMEWMIEEMVDDGDEIICLRVVEKDSKVASDVSVVSGQYREEAQKLLDSVAKKNSVEEKAINVIVELAVGRVQHVIQRMIQIYEPAALVVGTRGRNLGGMQGLLPGSVSKYCLQHSPIPVIVVRPTEKRIRKKQKRRMESGRSIYGSMLDKSTTSGRLSLYDKSVLEASSAVKATEEEAEAVAKAIGPPKGILRNRHFKNHYAPPPDDDDDANNYKPSFSLPLGYLSTESAPRADLAMKSPIIAGLVESWDTDDSRSASPQPRASAVPEITTTPSKELDPNASATSFNEDVFEDGEDQTHLGAPTIIEKRRPSVRASTPWLNSILTDKPVKRPTSRGRSGDRYSRSRSR